MLRSLLPALALAAGVLSGTPAMASGDAPMRIMPLGDSITAGVGVPGKDGYRLALQRALERAGERVDYVGSQKGGTDGDIDHEGHGGWTIDQLAEQTTGWVTTYRPDVVLLHAGTNNITLGEEPSAVAGKLSALIDQVRAAAPAARVYVATIVGTTVASEVAANRAYNALIPGVVAGKGALVRLVDQSAVDGLSIYDRHHPNAYGYARMAYAWYEGLRATIGPAWRIAADPDDTAFAYLCHYYTVRDCRWWQRRPVTTTVDGATVTRVQWQTRRYVPKIVEETVPGHYETVTKRVWVKGHHETRTVKKGTSKVWVKGRYVDRLVRTWVPATTVSTTRPVPTWVSS
ncbi:putative GDSL-like lipase/acylhydrolase [Actinoplanes missouriensis 431]|uniref:Putative GDSL-like lipase/acylhydrolase n=1 Tax=Actinoplanes missouriensis (strain ATCC 14538 / DSM 43046 / CBS 188.64 / JCM 3121 / NBRC 102363 / NCIMB 12654 / NRRL B-3342 / UNCC 431) TaxID=512565 RepID=I0H8K8_ACTM4|nr:SGNH/GDSL hydrolase family protein [Actinoplanes missouriensis]BAL89345.1 putative GDSL-like lipase/acylhydrolase [Actinoplanes missouriensis 431]